LHVQIAIDADARHGVEERRLAGIINAGFPCRKALSAHQSGEKEKQEYAQIPWPDKSQ
jgi:hypothetical protein